MTKTDVTQLLKRHTDGDPEALPELVPLVYKELQKLASYYLRGERSGHTLQTTALVHEAYIRLVDRKRVEWKDKNHFFAVAAQTMRRILVDYARKYRTLKRGGAAVHITFQDAPAFTVENTSSYLIVDELLTRLAQFDTQEARIIELRYFAGLSVAQTADVLDVSPATVKREWSVARAWLMREMTKCHVSDQE